MQQDKIKTILVNILTAAVVVGVVFAAYFVFLKKDTAISVSTIASVAKIAEETALIGTEIDYTVRDLGDLANAVESSNAVFDLPAFKNLQDFTVTIPREPIGRENPFVPTAWKVQMNKSLSSETSNTTLSSVEVQPRESAAESQAPITFPASIVPVVTPTEGI